jgi:hypothetical protein
MKNPVLLNWLLALSNTLLAIGIAGMFKLFKTVNNMRIYVRQICKELKIDCGKDLG